MIDEHVDRNGDGLTNEAQQDVKRKTSASQIRPLVDRDLEE